MQSSLYHKLFCCLPLWDTRLDWKFGMASCICVEPKAHESPLIFFPVHYSWDLCVGGISYGCTAPGNAKQGSSKYLFLVEVSS